MMREASVYALKKMPVEQRAAYGLRILTMRKWPRGISRKDIDLWLPSAAPSLALLAALHIGKVTWEEFLVRYQDEQETQGTCHVVTYDRGQPQHRRFLSSSISYLQHLEQAHGTVTVLCWEPGPQCHRYTLRDLVTQRSAGDPKVCHLEQHSVTVQAGLCIPGSEVG